MTLKQMRDLKDNIVTSKQEQQKQLSNIDSLFKKYLGSPKAVASTVTNVEEQ